MKSQPCPFCGKSSEGPPIGVRVAPQMEYSVTCSSCQATGPQKDSPEEAIEAWNKRFNAMPPFSGTIRADYKQPDKCNCPICDHPMKKVAAETGDGVALYWSCEFECHDPSDDEVRIAWPFEEPFVKTEDFVLLGFTLE